MFNGAATTKGALLISPERIIVTTPGADNKKRAVKNRQTVPGSTGRLPVHFLKTQIFWLSNRKTSAGVPSS